MESARGPVLNKAEGFTLIELLVVVAIIAVLSVGGIVLYTGINNRVQETRKKADIDSISKAYEANFDPTGNGGQGEYKFLAPSQFANNKIPTPDGTSGTSYVVIGPDAPAGPLQIDTSYAVCANLSGTGTCIAPTANTCYCAGSTQGQQATSCGPYPIITSGLAGYWKMDESSWNNNCSADTVLDSSGSSKHGRSCPNGSGPLGGASSNPVIGGAFGTAGSFDGTNDYIDLPSLSIPSPDGSISLWIYPNGFNSDVISSGVSNNDFRILLVSSGNSFYGFYIGTDPEPINEYRVQTSTKPALATWSHLVLTWSSSSGTKLYINGVNNPADVNNNPLAVFTPTGVNLGRNRANANNWFNGTIDEVATYNRVLSSSEVSSLYNNGKGCVP